MRFPPGSRGQVAVVLAIAVGLSVLVLVVGASIAIVDRGNLLTDAQVGLVATALGGLIGAVAVYLGGHSRDDDDDRKL